MLAGQLKLRTARGYKSLQGPLPLMEAIKPLLYRKKVNFPDGRRGLFPLSWTTAENAETRSSICMGTMAVLLGAFPRGNLTSAGTEECRDQDTGYFRR